MDCSPGASAEDACLVQLLPSEVITLHELGPAVADGCSLVRGYSGPRQEEGDIHNWLVIVSC